MNIGEFTVEHLSEGHFELFQDGTFLKKDAPEILKRRQQEDTLYRSLYLSVGIDPILVKGHGATLLLDTGMGIGLDMKHRDPAISNIITNLEVFETDPSEVTHVVLTHLHSDHTGGLAYVDERSRIRSTLPNAQIIVQRKEWEFALEMIEFPNELSDARYELDNLYRLVSDGQITFIDQDVSEPVPGIELIRTGGHTPGHQIVRIKSAGDTAYYFGDLIPNEDYLGFRMMPNADVETTESRQIKMLLMKQAHLEMADVLFYHSVHLKAGKLTKDMNRQYTIKS